MLKSCYVVIPNWNGLDFISDCLESLRTQTQKHTVIVVDNGSTDGSNDVVREKFPEVQLLEFGNNAGFAGGVNRGIRPALEQGADCIALLNDDAVADKNWLKHLVERMSTDNKIGAVAAKIRTQDGKGLDSTGDFYSIWGYPFPRGRQEADHGQYDHPKNQNIFAASGGASLYRAETLKQIGLFDERFFAYYEDTDIGFRMQLAGWKVLYEPEATVRHFIGGTSSKMNTSGQSELTEEEIAKIQSHNSPSPFARFHSVKNFTYLYTKNMPGWLYWKYLPRFWASWGMMLVSDIKRGLFVSNMKANATALRAMPGVFRDRSEIQKQRMVSAASIDKKLYHQLPPLQRLRFARMGLVKK